MVSWQVHRNGIRLGTHGLYFFQLLISVHLPPSHPTIAVLKASGHATMCSTCNPAVLHR